MSKQPRQSRRPRNARNLKPRSRRVLRPERLEDRMMLNADMPLHNDNFPLDTNGDSLLTPGDALAVINQLNSAQASNTSPVAFVAEGEGPVHLKMTDVNADGLVTPNDALRVINALNAEGESGPVLRVTTKIFERPANYPFDSGGNRVQATNEITSIGVGQDFVVKLLVADIRTMATREGVFSTYVDVNFDNPAVATLVQSLPMVVHPQSGAPTPYLHNNVGFIFGESAVPFQPTSGPVVTGLIDTDGNGSLDQIDRLGSFSGNLRGSGAGDFVLVEWAMTASSAGTLTINAEPTTEDPADDPNDAGESPLYDGGLFGQDAPICPSQSTVEVCMGDFQFIADTITVVDRISAVNDGPGGPYTFSENAGPQTLSVLANDINNTNGTLTITGVTQGTKGSVTNNGNNVTYTPSGASGSDTFTYTIGNGLGDSSTGTVSVNITPVNDPPINSVPGPQSTNEDVSKLLPPIGVSDADGNVNMQVNLAGVLGTISVPTTPNVTITNPNTASVTLNGLVNDVNNALASVTFVPTPNANGAGRVTVTSNDGIASDTDIINITINPVNDAPVNTVPGPQTVFNTDTLTFGVGAFSVSDIDATTLEVKLSVLHGTVGLGTTAGLTINGNNTASLTATGSISNLNTALNSLVYDPTNTYFGPDTLTMVTSDLGQTGIGGTLTDTDTVGITVNPPITPFAAPDFFSAEEDSATALTFNLSQLLSNDIKPLPTADNTLSLTMINGMTPATGSYDTSQGGSVSYDSNSGTFTYSPPQADFFGTETFTYTIESSPNEGDGPSTGTVNIEILPINDGPINTVPGSQSVDEDNTLAFSGGNAISVTDIDAGAAGVTVTLTVGHGKVNVTAGSGVTNNGTANVQLDGTVAQVNSLLATLVYTPVENYNGPDTLNIIANDNGNTGGAAGNPTANNPLSDTDTVNITIQPINDAPTIVVPGAQTFITDFDNILSTANGNAFSIADVDADPDDVQVDLTIGNGTLTIGNVSGLSSVSGNGTNSVTIQGSVANINTALGAGVNYRTSVDGNETLTATVNDLGNNGGVAGDPNANNPLSDSDTVAIEVLDFVPSNVGGFVFIDIDNDAAKESGEVGLEGVHVLLTGTTFRNTPVNMEAFTNSAGWYLFGNLEPGNYVLRQEQPANLNDGKESFPSAAVNAAGNDQANIAIPIAGNIDSRDNNFGERGLSSYFISMYDLLDSQFRRPGALLSSDGISHWSSLLGDGWDGYSNPRVDLVAMTFTVADGSGTDRVVDLRAADPARHGGTYMDHIMLRKQGQNEVIRVTGSAADFGLAANDSGEGESGVPAVESAGAMEMYAQAVDAFFGEMA